MKVSAVIVGYSGHGYVVADILLSSGLEIAGYCERRAKEQNPYGLNYLGDEFDEETLKAMIGLNIYLGIGDNHNRSRLYQHLSDHNMNLPLLSDPKSTVSKLAQIGSGTIIMPGSIVNALTKIGNGVILNTGCVVEHECTISNFAHIGPGAILAGGVSVGEKTFIGAGSVVRQSINIGSNVVIGAGSVIVKDVPAGVTVFGNPGRIK